MVELQTAHEKVKNLYYRTDKMLIVTFNQCSYDKVWVSKDGKVEQACQNIQSCTQETNTL